MKYEKLPAEVEMRHSVSFPAWGAALRGPLANQRKEMGRWCREVFGNPMLDMRWNDDIVFGKVSFLHEADAMLFLARWS